MTFGRLEIPRRSNRRSAVLDAVHGVLRGLVLRERILLRVTTRGTRGMLEEKKTRGGWLKWPGFSPEQTKGDLLNEIAFPNI